MAFTEIMNNMREDLQRSLDELTSPRSTLKSKTLALQNLERNLATASCPSGSDSQDAKDAFFALQYTFECNLPSRLLPWIMATTSRLETLTNNKEDDGRGMEIDELSAQLAVSLTLIQGVTLNHEASKTYMGRKPALEILLDLLLTSRHIPSGIGTGTGSAAGLLTLESSPTKGSGSSSAPPTQPHLSSVVLDTLLCILVDCSTALRALEEANGVHSIVKILKRAGTPREVRMKCLEFLYFYLLDESPDPSAASLLAELKATQPTPPPTAPATPVRSSSSPSSSSIEPTFSNPKQKPYMNATPLRPSSTMSRYGSSSFSFSTSASTSSSTTDGKRLSTSASSLASVSTSSRSTSGSSMHSFSSTSSNASSSTAASSMPASPVKECFSPPPPPPLPQPPALKTGSKFLTKSPVKRAGISNTSNTPTTMTANNNNSGNSTTTSRSLRRQATVPANADASVAILPRSLMMLRKEVEFVPLSPKKSPSLSSPSTPSSGGSTATPGTPVNGTPTTLMQNGTPAKATGVSGVKMAARPGYRPRAGGHRKSLSTSTLSASGLGAGERAREKEEKESREANVMDRHFLSSSFLEKEKDKIGVEVRDKERDGDRERDGERVWKTTKEKKELLGTVMSNVDVFVESVSKAGIWGLG